MQSQNIIAFAQEITDLMKVVEENQAVRFDSDIFAMNCMNNILSGDNKALANSIMHMAGRLLSVGCNTNDIEAKRLAGRILNVGKKIAKDQKKSKKLLY